MQPKLFKGKPVRVVITGRALESFEELNKITQDETVKGITNSEYQTLFNSIKEKIDFLKENPQYGTHISKNKIPKEYVNLYGVTNLWKLNLSGAWRMIYTIRGTKIEIVSLILDILNHKNYSKKFGYRKHT